MSDARDLTAEARAHTDASLGAERASTDDASQRAATRAQRALDDLIERDRLLADARLLRYRDRADRMLFEERSASSQSGSSIRMERYVADEGTRNERAVMDGLLENERARADVAVEVERREQEAHQAQHGAHRRATDDQLTTERSEADAAVFDLGTTKDTLAEVRSEQTRGGDVLGVVAHELRSPLSVVVLNAALLVEKSADPVLRDAAHDVMRAAARMERLLADLLDVTRIQSGAMAIVREEHDIGELLIDVLRSYQPLFAARGLTFTVDPPPAPMIGSFDHDRVVQVLSNLLANAMKFTPAGGTVRLQAERGEGLPIELVLKDNGPGISASALPHVFERFWQVDSNTTRGLGLGLFICKKIVEAHAGVIWVESSPGRGSTFRFTLPDG